MSYPMWHTRFVNARNALGEACEQMEQAWFEDRHNPAFEKLHKRMQAVFGAVCRQNDRNYKRGKKEGWHK